MSSQPRSSTATALAPGGKPRAARRCLYF